jgi:hypothetical protein
VKVPLLPFRLLMAPLRQPRLKSRPPGAD